MPTRQIIHGDLYRLQVPRSTIGNHHSPYTDVSGHNDDLLSTLNFGEILNGEALVLLEWGETFPKLCAAAQQRLSLDFTEPTELQTTLPARSRRSRKPSTDQQETATTIIPPTDDILAQLSLPQPAEEHCCTITVDYLH